MIVAVPLGLALLGPLFAGAPGPRAASFTLGGGHWLGTDFVGRDVWQQVLLGGRSVVLVALAATALAYLVALPLGLISRAHPPDVAGRAADAARWTCCSPCRRCC